jgi:hypothetical protein
MPGSFLLFCPGWYQAGQIVCINVHVSKANQDKMVALVEKMVESET